VSSNVNNQPPHGCVVYSRVELQFPDGSSYTGKEEVNGPLVGRLAWGGNNKGGGGCEITPLVPGGGNSNNNCGNRWVLPSQKLHFWGEWTQPGKINQRRGEEQFCPPLWVVVFPGKVTACVPAGLPRLSHHWVLPPNPLRRFFFFWCAMNP